MSKGRKNNANNSTFMQIPKLETVETVRDKIIKNVQRKGRLRQQKEILTEQKQEIRVKLYNISLELNEIDNENEQLLIKNGFTF
jgi:hypothetical protein